MFRRIHWAVITMLLGAAAIAPQANNGVAAAGEERIRGIYKELIEIDTTGSAGDNTKAAEAMAARLRAAGFPEIDIQVLGPHPKKGNLIARYRGTGERPPLLLLAHLDVVEARREDWTFAPFTLTEKDGYFYGRGAADDKAMAAIWVETFIRLKSEGWKPKQDLILALTADEEGGQYNGVEWLLKTHRDLVHAAFCLNEGGNGQLREGKPLLLGVQASEKVYQSFTLEAKSRGGHSSRPGRDNAIYTLAAGLTRLEKYEFPPHLNEVTRAYYDAMSRLYTRRAAADMAAVAKPHPSRNAIKRLTASAYDNALLRTTCVPTRLEGGHADNALPQTARATVNCRLLPSESPEMIYETIIRVLEDDRIVVRPIDEPQPSPASPLQPEIMNAIEQTAAELWPGVPVIPVMSTGATDGLYLRNAGIPTYGVSGLFSDVEDDRTHGKDERIGVQQFFEGREFLYRLVKAFSS